MATYRVLQIRDNFYPQERKFLSWKYIDSIHYRHTWDKEYRHLSYCTDIEDAKKVITKRRNWLEHNKLKPIIHNIK